MPSESVLSVLSSEVLIASIDNFEVQEYCVVSETQEELFVVSGLYGFVRSLTTLRPRK